MVCVRGAERPRAARPRPRDRRAFDAGRSVAIVGAGAARGARRAPRAGASDRLTEAEAAGEAGGLRWFCRSRRRSLHDAHVRGLRALLPVGHVELHGLPFLEVAVALTRDRGIVHEHVRTTVLEDEAEALLRAEPLHGSC